MHLVRRGAILITCALVGLALVPFHADEPSLPLARISSDEAVAAGDEPDVVIRQRNKFYDPPVVVVHVGDTVGWVNETAGGWHDVNSYEGEFASGRMDYGTTFSQTFEQPGVYGFYCVPHSFDGMIGSVVVVEKGKPLPDPLPSPPTLTSSPNSDEPVPPGAPNTIFTVAGSSGNGGRALDASLYRPEGVGADDAGRVYIADTDNCQIRVLEPSGRIISILGHESCGFTMGYDEDLGPWLHTNHPAAVAVGPDGSPYVSDTGNCRVRRGREDGTVMTVAGSGSCRASGDGGPAVEAGLSPWGLTVSRQGEVYVADVFNCRVRKIDQDGIITTVAGNGTCGFSGDGGPATEASLFFPRDVAITPDGTLYIADTANCRVRRINPATGAIETLAGSGSCSYGGDGVAALRAGLQPWGVAVDADGRILVVDRENCRLRRFAPGGAISTIAGTGVCGHTGDNGPAAEAALNWPSDIVLAADGTIYLADTGSCRVRRIDADGTIATAVGSGVCDLAGDGGPAVAAGIWHAMAVVTNSEGDWFFSELDTCRIRRVDADGVVTTYAGTGVCGHAGDGGPATEARLSDFVGGLALADDGTMYFAEGYNCRVRRIDPDQTIDTVVGTGECGYDGDGGPASEANVAFVSDVRLDGKGGLYVAEPFNCVVRRVDLATGIIDTVVGDGSCLYNGEDVPALSAGVEPWGVAVGPDGFLYLTDAGNCRVRRVGPEGRITTVAGEDLCGYEGDGGPATEAQLLRPDDVEVDAEGNVYISDVRTFTVRKVDSRGIISTVAGVGIARPIDAGGFDPTQRFNCTLSSLIIPAPAYLGDGGPATQGGLYFPDGITIGHDGHLYIADTFDHRVRRVTCGDEVPCAGPAIASASSGAGMSSDSGSLEGGVHPSVSRAAIETEGGGNPVVWVLGAIGGAVVLVAGIWLLVARWRRSRAI